MKYKLEVEPFARNFMAEQGGKALALKPLEEAAEVFGAWQRYKGDEWDDTDGDLERMLRDEIADELADTVQACVNLADRESLDLGAALSRVHDRNAKRGRHKVRGGCEEGADTCADEAGRVATALCALESPDWPQLTRAVLGRNGTRREVVQRLADLILYTGRRVYDADGVEIKVGDTVWHHSGFAHGVVTSIDAGSLMSTARYVNGGVEFRDAAKDLTHTRPDSWERLEEDAVKGVCAYFGFLNKCCDDGDECPANKPGDCAKFKVLDIIRRAKALAGVEAEA